MEGSGIAAYTTTLLSKRNRIVGRLPTATVTFSRAQTSVRALLSCAEYVRSLIEARIAKCKDVVARRGLKEARSKHATHAIITYCNRKRSLISR
jgi:hypothetical protein